MLPPLELHALRAAVEAGQAFTYRFFWGDAPRADGQLSDAVLSQWWMGRFEVDGQAYDTAARRPHVTSGALPSPRSSRW